MDSIAVQTRLLLFASPAESEGSGLRGAHEGALLMVPNLSFSQWFLVCHKFTTGSKFVSFPMVPNLSVACWVPIRTLPMVSNLSLSQWFPICLFPSGSQLAFLCFPSGWFPVCIFPSGSQLVSSPVVPNLSLSQWFPIWVWAFASSSQLVQCPSGCQLVLFRSFPSGAQLGPSPAVPNLSLFPVVPTCLSQWFLICPLPNGSQCVIFPVVPSLCLLVQTVTHWFQICLCASCGSQFVPFQVSGGSVSNLMGLRLPHSLPISWICEVWPRFSQWFPTWGVSLSQRFPTWTVT